MSEASVSIGAAGAPLEAAAVAKPGGAGSVARGGAGIALGAATAAEAVADALCAAWRSALVVSCARTSISVSANLVL